MATFLTLDHSLMQVILAYKSCGTRWNQSRFDGPGPGPGQPRRTTTVNYTICITGPPLAGDDDGIA